MIIIETKRHYDSEWILIPNYYCYHVHFFFFLVVSSWKKKTSGVYPK